MKKKLERFLSVKLSDQELHFSIPNVCAIERVKTFWSKEPETLLWIQSFDQDDIFYDIGANMGVYALYAGSKGIKTYAFEPESQNFALLNKNIFANHLMDHITAFPLAISDENALDKLYLSHFFEATSGHHYKEKINHNHEPLNPAFQQGCISMSIDSLAHKLTFPNHLKIDVDGIEHKILNGAQKTLSDTRLKSVLVELNGRLDKHKSAYQMMAKMYHCTEPLQESVQNYIFYRAQSPLIHLLQKEAQC